jgi:CBS domain-containing protein
LNGSFVLQAVVGLLLVKSVIWLAALSSGTSGGVLAPLLILGGAMGWVVGMLLPGQPGAWALLGMAAMLGGTMRAPLMSAVFAVELTGEFRMLAPLLAASVAAYAVTVLLMKRSILTEKIARRGGHVTREYSIDPYELTRVGDVMVRQVDVLAADLSIEAAIGELEQGRHRIYPVVDTEGRPIGLVSRADALRWRRESGHEGETLGDQVSDAAVAVVRPDDVVGRAADIMIATGQGRIPVVEVGAGRLCGLVTRKDLLKVRAAVTRSEQDRQGLLPSLAR